MNTLNIQNKPYSFTGRCPQIRDAQWVCHTVNTAYPHSSTSKLKPMLTNLYMKTFPDTPKRPKSMFDLYMLLNENVLSCEEFYFIKSLRLSNLDEPPIYCPNHNFRILRRAKELLDTLADIRIEQKAKKQSNLINVFEFFKTHKTGNCFEDAVMSEFILKLNGVKNAKSAVLLDTQNGEYIDHAVCLFNRDGSVVDKITKNTIIIDPWATKVDFATNMDKFYKNEMTEFLHIPTKDKIEYEIFDAVHITDNDIPQLREKLPNLLFPNITHKFMQ